MWLFGKQVEQGSEMPRGYGVSYFLGHRDAAVCHPMPLNFAVAWCRVVWLYWKRGVLRRQLLRLQQEHLALRAEKLRLSEKIGGDQ